MRQAKHGGESPGISVANAGIFGANVLPGLAICLMSGTILVNWCRKRRFPLKAWEVMK
jgi:hypothetical protein